MKTRTNPINNPEIQEWMDDENVETYVQLEEKSGVHRETLRSWANMESGCEHRVFSAAIKAAKARKKKLGQFILDLMGIEEPDLV